MVYKVFKPCKYSCHQFQMRVLPPNDVIQEIKLYQFIDVVPVNSLARCHEHRPMIRENMGELCPPFPGKENEAKHRPYGVNNYLAIKNKNVLSVPRNIIQVKVDL